MSHIYSRMTPEQQRERDERDLEILRLHEQGLSTHKIGREIGIDQSTVQKFLKDMEPHL